MNQHQTTIQHIELYIKKYIVSEGEVKRDYMHKILGMLSLAKMLDIIKTEEYEHYFNSLFE